MTRADNHPARKMRVLAFVAGCVVPVVAACSSQVAAVQLPPKPHATTAAAVAKAAPLTPRQQVIDALTGYTTALGIADKSKNKAQARQLLRPFLVASRIDGMVTAIGGLWAKGDVFYGQDVLHILSVRVDGHHAFVHDCDNTSGMGLKNGATGQTVPGSVGVSNLNLVTRLDLVGGRWLVEFQTIEDVPCEP